MKKKFISVFLLAVMVLGLTACGNNGGSILPISKGFSEKDLSIEDFKWETKPSKYYGEDCYEFSLTNNSKYDVIGVAFVYKVKDEVSESQLSVYDEFMSEHDGYIEEDDSPKDVTLIGEENQLVQKGETLTGLRFTVGFQDYSWYDYPTTEQFELMEPKELQLGIVSDNKLYIAYYDFEEKSWKLDSKKVDVDVWSNKEIGKKLNKPNGKHNVIISDKEDYFEIYSYGISEEMYKEYVETLKSSGFAEEDYNSYSFEGKNSDGYVVYVWYEESNEYLNIDIEKED